MLECYQKRINASTSLQRFMRFILSVLFIQLVLSAQKQQAVGFEARQAVIKKAIQCKPFGVRLNLGRSVIDPSSNQKLGIRFNTAQKCQSVNLLLSNIIVFCPVRPVSKFKMQKGQQFVTFIHQCSLRNQINYNQKFSYNLIDQDSLKTYFSIDIELTVKDPAKMRQVRFIHFADWGKTDQHPNIIDPIKRILFQGQTDAIIINGDIGYEINSNVTHHLEFMEALEGISKLCPIIFNRGNHEYKDAALFFCEYFQVYDLCSRNATSLQVGSAFLSLFDPQAALIPRKFKYYTQSQRLSSRVNLQNDLKKGKQSGRLIIALSHYPMVCGFPTTEHCIPDKKYKEFLPLYVNLQQHFNTLIDNRVPLILSGHMHTYQRTYQLLKGYKYKSNSNYQSSFVYNSTQQATLIQIIDGVSGSGNELLQNYTFQGVEYQVQPFIAKYNLNKVGFGVLKVGKANINYEHFGVNIDGSLEALDNLTISFPDRETNPEDQL